MIDAPSRTDCGYFHTLTSRYQDNDANGFLSSAAVHACFESAVQAFLLQRAGLDLREGALAAFVIHTSADFLALPGFPDDLEVGLGILGASGSTVEYRLVLFRRGDDQACATGRWVQVFVDRASGEPARLPEGLREALRTL
ncbi:acyl-CoA thioesterase [Pseudomonas entomophila]|uniref:acyl-CoA thioesterase n=1 Tax=Pseudomonas entomophila TaxID=312306 RepID=UPI0015E2E739|nr:thioesterase family protein [Pseudomonas entomophila]MBA1188660.1 acyl-CoA thioesterase [Pseudomonas entomophila]